MYVVRSFSFRFFLSRAFRPCSCLSLSPFSSPLVPTSLLLLLVLARRRKRKKTSHRTHTEKACTYGIYVWLLSLAPPLTNNTIIPKSTPAKKHANGRCPFSYSTNLPLPPSPPPSSASSFFFYPSSSSHMHPSLSPSLLTSPPLPHHHHHSHHHPPPRPPPAPPELQEAHPKEATS